MVLYVIEIGIYVTVGNGMYIPTIIHPQRSRAFYECTAYIKESDRAGFTG